jgi:acetyl esterase/lipase
MRFINRTVSENQPRLQVLIYPVVQFFDLMLPSYQQSIIDVFDSGKNSLMVKLYLNKSISNEILSNKHTTIQQKKKFRSFVDWSLIPDKYRQIYKEPIADHIDEDADLINNAKQLLDPDISPLLVENELLAKLPPTYMLTVGHDRLRDEGFIYAARLKANGVAVVHQHIENIFHGSLTFLEGIFKLDIAHQMLKDISKYLKDYL